MIRPRMRVARRCRSRSAWPGASRVPAFPARRMAPPSGRARRGRDRPAVTPKTEAPNEARALSRAFSNVAKALGPSVVRIEVEVARGGAAAAGRIAAAPDAGAQRPRRR